MKKKKKNEAKKTKQNTKNPPRFLPQKKHKLGKEKKKNETINTKVFN